MVVGIEVVVVVTLGARVVRGGDIVVVVGAGVGIEKVVTVKAVVVVTGSGDGVEPRHPEKKTDITITMISPMFFRIPSP